MSPAVTVKATDANGNTDTDYDGLEIVLSSSGSMLQSPLIETSINGEATFDNLVHTETGSDFVLTASEVLFPDITSEPFDVVSGPIIIAILDFDATTPEWTYTTSIPFFTNPFSFDDYYGIIPINNASPIDNSNFSNNILGENDLENNNGGTSDFATITFTEIDLTGFNNAELSFDWDIVGYNANSDDAKYELFFDGVAQGAIYLVDGGVDFESNEGSVTVNIPDTVTTVSLSVSIRNNGGSGYSGFDNFKLMGIQVPQSISYTFNDGLWLPNDPNNQSPELIDDIEILSGNAEIVSDLTINDITVYPGATLTVLEDVILTTTNTVLQSTANLYSGLILNGTASILGNITYNRYTNVIGTSGVPGGNDLVSAPLISADPGFDNFLTFGEGSPNSTILPTNGTFYAWAPFDNLISQYTNFSVNSTNALISGKGYRAATNTGQTLTFNGAVETGSPSMTITYPEGGTNWNLIGNPYPSYIKSNGTDSFLNSSNIAALDDEAIAIYGYNSGTMSGPGTIGNFTIINALTNSEVNIAPGQGFFVAHDPDNNTPTTVTFNPEMATVTGTDDFIINNRNSNETFMLRLRVSNSNSDFATEIYFTENASQGLDPGYDAAVMSAFASPLMVYSHLVDSNQGRNMAIQALALTDLNDVTIPIGVEAVQGQQLTFSIDSSTLPLGTQVFFDDNHENTSTLLNTNEYSIVTTTVLDGTGRFFLRFSNNVLSNMETDFQSLNIIVSQQTSELIINGNLPKNTKSKLLDLQGRNVYTFEISPDKNQQRIDVSHLSTGIYILKISNTNSNLSKKIILK